MADDGGEADASEILRRTFEQMFELFWAKDGTAAAADHAMEQLGRSGRALVKIFPGGITWVDEDYHEPASGLTHIIGNPFVRPSRAPEPDSPATRDLANALERTIAANTWNGTSFGRK